MNNKPPKLTLAEAAAMAVDVLENLGYDPVDLREALAEQAEQEPVAWFVQYKNRHEFVFGSKPEFIVDGVVEPLYAAPVRTKDLTDDEIDRIAAESIGLLYIDFARAVITADRKKNSHEKTN